MPLTRRVLLEKSVALGVGTVASLLDLGGALKCFAAPDDTLAFTHVTVIDATGGPALDDRTVIVEGDRIRKIGKSPEIAVPKSARVVDASGKYLIPGLWDMHVHARGTPALLADNEAWLSLYIANGITGVREMGGDYAETVFQWRTETAKGARIGPRILSSGPRSRDRIQSSPDRLP